MSYYRKNYYHRRYFRRKSRNPDFFEMIIEIIFGLCVIAWISLFKLFGVLFSRKNKITGLFKLNEKVIINNHTPDFVVENNTETNLQTNEKVDGKYRLKGSLLRPEEKEFFEVLKTIVGGRYIIEPQVQLSAIVSPVDSNDRFTNYHDFNKIKAKSIDFVLYDSDYKPHLAIELDGSSHLRWDRMKSDQFKDELMQKVGLRLIRIPVSNHYETEYLRKQIFG